MASKRIAVPSQNPGGLEAMRSGHFGRCDCFTLVDIEEGEIKNVSILNNIDHQEGGCLVPVRLLHDNNVDVIIVGGMGLRPLMGFRQVGIEVLVGEGQFVKDSINAYLEGRTPPMDEANVCRGH